MNRNWIPQVPDLKSQVSNLRSQVSGLKSQVSSLRSHTRNFQSYFPIARDRAAFFAIIPAT